LFQQEKVILYQHLVIDEQGNFDTYRFWNHFFSNADLKEILQAKGFNDINFRKNLIPSGAGYKSDDVTFCKATSI